MRMDFTGSGIEQSSRYHHSQTPPTRESLAINGDFVRFHCFLNRGTNFAESHIDTRFLHNTSAHLQPWRSFCTHSESRVSGIFHCGQKIVKLRVKGHSKCAIDDTSVDLDSKINFQHVVLGQNSLFTWKSHVSFSSSAKQLKCYHWIRVVWRVVRGTIVQ